MKFFTLSFLILINLVLSSQNLELSVEQIMQDPSWMGNFPSSGYWADDAQSFYFNWNPDNAPSDSLYVYDLTSKKVSKVESLDARAMVRGGDFNSDKSKKVFNRNGDIYIREMNSGAEKQITNTLESESSVKFSKDSGKIFYTQNNNVFEFDIENGFLNQISNFSKGNLPPEKAEKNETEKWVEDEEMKLMMMLKRKQDKRDASKDARAARAVKRPYKFYYGEKSIDDLSVSPDGQYVSFYLTEEDKSSKETIVPSYVTNSGYTEDLPARPNVGRPDSKYELYLFDVKADTVFQLMLDGQEEKEDYKGNFYGKPMWSEDGEGAIAIVQSLDNKNRWIVSYDLANKNLKVLDHQYDEAWIGGPGISSWRGYPRRYFGWIDDENIWYQSEESGWSHLYTQNIKNGKKKQITKGDFEIFDPKISKDKQHWYFTSSEVNLGERHFYKMPIKGGKAEKLTSMKGNNRVSLSPDEKYLMIRHSYSNKPWEYYLQENIAGAEAIQITDSRSSAFNSYDWRIPEVLQFQAADKQLVTARLYQPENPEKKGPAVMFVHGAGYLQNAHHWWSTYYREYMFHNFLVDKGYTVIDIDYRGSSGYGRDWRTGIYRHMGGKDLSDYVDGAKFLVEEYDIDPERIGIYGGSYGGFISIMALFKNSETFACGAALRSVTDWAHYNHLYTANILNTPAEDSIAYQRSSPIYFAEGLEKPLLMCHGMIDRNVHFQDVVRLSQRLIELGKDDWELAVYPLEPHSFIEPESWTDEYKRIFKLFEENLK